MNQSPRFSSIQFRQTLQFFAPAEIPSSREKSRQSTNTIALPVLQLRRKPLFDRTICTEQEMERLRRRLIALIRGLDTALRFPSQGRSRV
jgi:hypothetical protein